MRDERERALEAAGIPVVDAEELAGVTMIQFLQKLKGIERDFKTSLAGWRGMTEWERHSTKTAYNFFLQNRN
jgi:hypothetical protein